MKMRVLGLALGTFLASVALCSAANASVFIVDVTSGSNSGSLNLTVTDGGALVTALTGTFNGNSVTLDPVNTVNSNDNLFGTGFPYFDGQGLGFGNCSAN